MNQTLVYLILSLTGLCLGSFAGASVWRLRARQLEEDKKAGENFDQKEYSKLKKLNNKSITQDHSQCLNCSYKLKWYDMIPVLSWVTLGGKCRKCRKPIGINELLVEIFVAAFFVSSYIFWPFGLCGGGLEMLRFVIWLLAGVGLAILFIYDKKWSLLPDFVNFTVIGLGLTNAIIVIILSVNKLDTIYNILGSILILSGLYYMLFVISKGRWIGFGDIKLGLGLGLLLSDWKLAFIALFAANLIGCLVIIPGMITHKLKRTSHVPFGPLLIIGTLIAMLFGQLLIDFYLYNII